MVDVWGQGPCHTPGRGGQQHLGWALNVTAAPAGSSYGLGGCGRRRAGHGCRGAACVPTILSSCLKPVGTISQTLPPAPRCAHGDVGGPVPGTNGRERLGIDARQRAGHGDLQTFFGGPDAAWGLGTDKSDLSWVCSGAQPTVGEHGPGRPWGARCPGHRTAPSRQAMGCSSGVHGCRCPVPALLALGGGFALRFYLFI